MFLYYMDFWGFSKTLAPFSNTIGILISLLGLIMFVERGIKLGSYKQKALGKRPLEEDDIHKLDEVYLSKGVIKFKKKLDQRIMQQPTLAAQVPQGDTERDFFILYLYTKREGIKILTISTLLGAGHIIFNEYVIGIDLLVFLLGLLIWAIKGIKQYF